MVQHHRRDIRGGWFLYWYGACQFSVPMGDDDDKMVVVAGLGE